MCSCQTDQTLACSCYIIMCHYHLTLESDPIYNPYKCLHRAVEHVLTMNNDGKCHI